MASAFPVPLLDERHAATGLDRAPGRGELALFAGAVFLGPALALWHLRGLWNPAGDYAYGWVVPFLALFLAKCRWDDRPRPSTPLRSATLLVIACALAILPARWLHEAAPERSVCAWWDAGAGAGVSLGLIALAGGRAWLRWFAFPFAFILTAAPWPHGLETLISDSLMRHTAAATVEILCMIGVPSAQAGNLVHLETGVIDIDEACSGIRSLQAMVMVSLFLGELFRLRPARRGALLLFGLAATVLANLLRTVALSLIGFHVGMAAVDRWHDGVGFAVLALTLFTVLGAAFWLRDRAAPTAPAFLPALRVRLSIGIIAWMIATEVSVEAWYRVHTPKWEGWSWAVAWPRGEPGFHFIEIPKRSVELLMCDQAAAARWQETGGGDCSAYWIQWNPGNPLAEAAKVHRPDVCLIAEGATLEQDLGIETCPAGGMRIPFQRYVFQLNGEPLYVFFCLAEEGDATSVSDTWNRRFEEVEMFRRAVEGRRNPGEQSFELALSGYPSQTAAEAAVRARLPRLILRGQR